MHSMQLFYLALSFFFFNTKLWRGLILQLWIPIWTHNDLSLVGGNYEWYISPPYPHQTQIPYSERCVCSLQPDHVAPAPQPSSRLWTKALLQSNLPHRCQSPLHPGQGARGPHGTLQGSTHIKISLVEGCEAGLESIYKNKYEPVRKTERNTISQYG